MLVVRYWDRRVRTLAVWLMRPPKAQLATLVRHGDVRANIQQIVIPDFPATRLLANPATVMWAPAADPEGRSDEELCELVAQALVRHGATTEQIHVAAVAAMVAGRYDSMMQAIKKARGGPVIVEEFVKFGHDRGFAAGEAQGEMRGRLEVARSTLAQLLASRFEVGASDEQRIQSETDPERLQAWFQRALTAKALQEVWQG